MNYRTFIYTKINNYIAYRGTRNETIELPPRQNFTDALWDVNDLIYDAPEGKTKFVFAD